MLLDSKHIFHWLILGFVLCWQVHANLRDWLKTNVSPEVAESTRIIYGGMYTHCLNTNASLYTHLLPSHLYIWWLCCYRICNWRKLQGVGRAARRRWFPRWWSFFEGKHKTQTEQNIHHHAWPACTHMTKHCSPLTRAAWVHRHHQRRHREVCLRKISMWLLPAWRKTAKMKRLLFSLLCLLCVLC